MIKGEVMILYVPGKQRRKSDYSGPFLFLRKPFGLT
ncbi:hypothetical protein SLEP1_g44212 [Rubroshorea leprosula]|uniref:Uncharacterized protein n=1 Tax=Rubroshorea leprosula TaxID=152421 RepID=A0AAV5LG78_9ROSI|nr:hypothetical protein SLEP1_g44212 [Rubroshorea leprosula]